MLQDVCIFVSVWTFESVISWHMVMRLRLLMACDVTGGALMSALRGTNVAGSSVILSVKKIGGSIIEVPLRRMLLEGSSLLNIIVYQMYLTDLTANYIYLMLAAAHCICRLVR